MNKVENNLEKEVILDIELNEEDLNLMLSEMEKISYVIIECTIPNCLAFYSKDQNCFIIFNKQLNVYYKSFYVPAVSTQDYEEPVSWIYPAEHEFISLLMKLFAKEVK